MKHAFSYQVNISLWGAGGWSSGSQALSAQDFTVSGLGRIGFHSLTDNETRYELTDHLGNIRVSFKSDGSGGLDVLSATDYYPFGIEIPGRGLTSSTLAAAHGYQGVFAEKDRHTNWTAFDLRNYDGRLGRFHNPDPMWQYHSPFMAMGNNPLSIIDPTGGWGDPIYSGGVLDEVVVNGNGPGGPTPIGVGGFFGSNGMPPGYGPVWAGGQGTGGGGSYFGSYSWNGPTSMWNGRAQPDYSVMQGLSPAERQARNEAATRATLDQSQRAVDMVSGPKVTDVASASRGLSSNPIHRIMQTKGITSYGKGIKWGEGLGYETEFSKGLDVFPKMLAVGLAPMAIATTSPLWLGSINTKLTSGIISSTTDLGSQFITGQGSARDRLERVNFISVASSGLFSNPFTSSAIGASFKLSYQGEFQSVGSSPNMSLSKVAVDFVTGFATGVVGNRTESLLSFPTEKLIFQSVFEPMITVPSAAMGQAVKDKLD